MFVVR